MTHDEFMNEVKRMFGMVRADAYKEGFTDGIAFITEPSTQLTNAFNKAKDHALSQIDEHYGRSREYWIATEVINAIYTDLMEAAHLRKPTKIEDYWEDEEIQEKFRKNLGKIPRKNVEKFWKKPGEIMEDFGMTFDLASYQFTDEETGFVLHAEDVMMEETQTIVHRIFAGTGVMVDELFIEVLRDTVESMDGNYPWQNALIMKYAILPCIVVRNASAMRQR